MFRTSTNSDVDSFADLGNELITVQVLNETSSDEVVSLRQVVDAYFDALVCQERGKDEFSHSV